MNPEVLRPLPDRLIKRQRTLANVCFNLAFKMSGGRWYDGGVRNTQLSRTLGEEIGDETVLAGERINKKVAPTPQEAAELQRLAGHTIDSTYSELTADFHASKRTVEDNSGNPVDLDYYRLSLSTRQSVEVDEIPGNILATIRRNKAEADRDEDDDDDVIDTPEGDALEDVTIEKETMIEYGINHTGEIDDYSMVYTYYLDDEEMFEMQYDNSETTRPTIPITLEGTDEPADFGPTEFNDVNETELTEDLTKIDASLTRLLEDEVFAPSFELDQLTHRRQALAVLALVTSNIFDIRRLARN